MKKYWIIFIIVLLFISFSCFSTAHNYNEWLVETRNINDNLYKNECVGVEKNHTEEWCNDRKKLSNYTQSFLEVLTEFFSYNLINGFPLLILLIFPSSFFVCRFLNSKHILNEMSRDKYSKLITKFILKSQFTVLIVLVYLVLIVLLAYNSSSGFSNFQSSIWGANSNSFMFIITFIVRNLLYVVFYNNVVLLCARKNSNFFICTISSIILILCIEVFLEVFVSIVLLQKFLNSDVGVLFNIINIPIFYDDYGLVWPIIIAIIMSATAIGRTSIKKAHIANNAIILPQP